MRSANAACRPVVRIRTAFSPDGGDVLRGRTDAPGPSVAQGSDFADLDPRVPSKPGDIVVTDLVASAHATSLEVILPRIARLESVDVLAPLLEAVGG